MQLININTVFLGLCSDKLLTQTSSFSTPSLFFRSSVYMFSPLTIPHLLSFHYHCTDSKYMMYVRDDGDFTSG